MNDSMLSELTFRSIIALWPSPDAMAADIGAGPSAVRKWSQRNRIPEEWWRTVLDAPRVRDAGITADTLATLAHRKLAEVR